VTADVAEDAIEHEVMVRERGAGSQ
jgi:hypothetical protein